MRILVVEDEPVAATILAKGLREHAYAVDIAADGADALERIATNDYDLIILDVLLPGINGLGMCSRLRGDRVTVPILMLTARGGPDQRVEGLDAAPMTTEYTRRAISVAQNGYSGVVRVSQAGGVWMRRTRLLFALGVSLWAAVVAANQAAPPVALSGALRAHVRDERFGIVTSIRGLPLGVRDGLQRLFGSQALDIAEPGAEFQVTDAILNPTLPIRRLVAAGCSTDHCLVYYERGGAVHTWQVALFHWTPAATRFEWGGTAPGGLTTIDDVRNAVLSGAIKSPARSW